MRSRFSLALGLFAVLLHLSIGPPTVFANATVTGATLNTSSDIALPDQLRHFYSRLEAQHVPTGILLEAGGILYTETILRHDGVPRDPDVNYRAPRGLIRSQFNDATGELMRGHIIEDRSPQLTRQAFYARRAHQRTSFARATPLALAFVEYDTLLQEPLDDSNHDGEFYLPSDNGPVGERKIFAAGTLQVDLQEGDSARWILRSGDIFTNLDAPIENLRLEWNGDSLAIEIGQPFAVSFAGLKGDRVRYFALRFSSNGVEYEAPGAFRHREGSALSGRIPQLECYEMGSVNASLPFRGETARIHLRVYPSQGTVTDNGGNGQSCHNGSNPQLRQVLVVVDGFDPLDNRDQDSIFDDFGEGISGFVEAGFDVVSVDYEDGRDYIQRNGLAIRELLVSRIPNWIHPQGDPRVVLIAGSMGGQTSRYALRTAELAGEDHNTELFIAIRSFWPHYPSTV